MPINSRFYREKVYSGSILCIQYVLYCFVRMQFHTLKLYLRWLCDSGRSHGLINTREIRYNFVILYYFSKQFRYLFVLESDLQYIVPKKIAELMVKTCVEVIRCTELVCIDFGIMNWILLYYIMLDASL